MVYFSSMDEVKTTRKVNSIARQASNWERLFLANGTNAHDLSVRAGIPYTTLLNATRRDIKTLTIATAMSICEALDITIDELVEVIRYK